MSGSGPTSTQSTTNPYASQWGTLIGNVSNLTGGGAGTLPVYGGPTVAPLSPNQTTAIDMARQFATAGSPAGNAANEAIVRQASGTSNPFGGMNPFIEQVINPSNQMIADAFARGTQSTIDAQGARSGGFGGTGWAESTGVAQRSLADALAANTSGLLSTQYNNSANLWNTDQARQLAAAQLGPGSQAADLNAIGALQNTGGMQQGNVQSILDAMQNQFGQQVSAQFTPAQILASILGQAQGNSTTTVQGPGSNNWLNGAAGIGLLISMLGGR